MKNLAHQARLPLVNICDLLLTKTDAYIGDHKKNSGNFCKFGGDFIAYLSWLASVSHFVIDYVTY